MSRVAQCLLVVCGALAPWGSIVFAQEGDDGARLEGDGARREQVASTLWSSSERPLADVEAELAATRAALASAASTSAWLAHQIEQLGAQATALDMGEAVARLTGLSARLADIDDRRASVAPVLAGLSRDFNGLKGRTVAELQGTAVNDSSALIQLQDDIRDRTEAMSAALLPTRQAADVLVRDVCHVNVAVEAVRTSLAALRGEVKPRDAEPVMPPAWLLNEPVVELRTSQGVLVLALRPDVSPRHVENFRRLVTTGFYDGLTFHRVVPGFLIQGGDPLGTGMGGPGWQIPAEFNALHHLRGTLSMARMGQWDTAGSQFFLCLKDWSQELDRKYTVFGKLLKGFATLDAIAALGSSSGEASETITILEAVLRERLASDVPDGP
jgi:cyclophilin family peptidyl-prolyl cis-trans isomerase